MKYQAQKEWKKRNPEKVRESAARCHKRWYEKNKEREKQRVAEYQKTEHGKAFARESQRRWYKENKVKAKKKTTDWIEKNRDWVNECARRNQKKPETRRKKIVYNLNRIKQYRKVSDGTITPYSIEELYKKQQGKCALSSIDISSKYHIDHIKPISRGGRHTISNIQLLAPIVNLRKSNKLDFIWQF